MIATLVALLGSFTIVYFLERWRGRPDLALARGGRIALSTLFAFTGVSHFLLTEPMAQMVPPPFPPVATVYATGVLEILGAIGLLLPGSRRLAAWCLFVFLVAVFPANVYAAMNATDLGGHVGGPAYLWQRAPLQILFLAWTWYFGIRGGAAFAPKR